MANSDVEPTGPIFNFVFGLISVVGAFWMYTVFAKYEASGGGFSMPRIAVVLYSLLGKWGVVIPVALFGAGSIWSGIQQLRKPQ